jgi:hypothetical protein
MLTHRQCVPGSQIIPAENLVAAYQHNTGATLLAAAADCAGGRVMLEALQAGAAGVLLRTDSPAEVSGWVCARTRPSCLSALNACLSVCSGRGVFGSVTAHQVAAALGSKLNPSAAATWWAGSEPKAPHPERADRQATGL